MTEPKRTQKDIDIFLLQQQEADRKRQEYIKLKEKEAELQRISEEKQRLELEEKRKLLNIKREEMIRSKALRREQQKLIQDKQLDDKRQLDCLREMRRDSLRMRQDNALIQQFDSRDDASSSQEYFMRSNRRVFVLLDVNGDGIISAVIYSIRSSFLS